MKTMIMLAFVSAALFVRAESDTIAFYPFCDKLPGESAYITVTNAATAGTMACSVGSKGTAPQAVFSSNSPGRYLYAAGTEGAELLVSGLQSIDLGQDDASISSAFLSIPDAPAALALCNESGHTVEFFFRLPPDAKLPGYSAALLYDCGYEYDGSTYPFCVYLACDTGYVIRYGLNGYNEASNAKGGLHGKITLGAAINARLTYALNDGNWHHFALVEKVSGSEVSVNLYIDRILVKTHALPEGVTRSTSFSDNSPEFKLVRGTMSGNLSGLRLSSRSLDPTEFLVASERAPGNYGSDVLGFYPFDDKEDGASAVGRTVFNAAQPMVAPCTVSTNSGNSVAEFSSEGPAKYVFVGEQYGATPYYTDPGSVFLSSSSAGESGSLDFYRMATELSKCHGCGHTVEWFFKLTDDNIKQMVSSFYCNAGYLHGTAEEVCSLYFPFSMSSNYDEGRQFRFSLGSYDNTERRIVKSLDYQPTNGLWHHIAIVSDGTKLEIFIDYVSYGTVALDGTQEVVGDRSLALVRNALHGKFSCVKVTKRPLGTDEFLRASNIATYWPKTLSHVTFDGAVGEALSGMQESAAVSFAGANPGVYAAQDYSGGVVLNSAVDGNPVRSDIRACRRPMVSGEGEDRENAASVYTVSTEAGDTGFRPAPHFRMPVSSRHVLPSDFTMEGFFRFDKTSWVEGAGEYAKGRDRLCLMSRRLTSGYSWKLSVVDAFSRTSHRLWLYAFKEDGEDAEVLTSQGVFNDDTWHHVAVTHDSSLNRMVVYCDYKPVLAYDLGQALLATSSGYIAVGDGRSVSDNDFHGWVDEVRYSNVCLESKEFLRQSSSPVGMSIMVR